MQSPIKTHTMKLLPSTQYPGCIALSPITPDEETFTKELSRQPEGFLLGITGRTGADVGSPLDQRMNLVLKQDVPWIRQLLTASDNESEQSLRLLRDALFLAGDGGLYLAGSTKESRKVTVHLYVQRCKHCKTPIINNGRARWQTCSACVSRCSHRYTSGHVTGGKAGALGLGEYCQSCGEGKKRGRVKPLLSHGEVLIIAV